jgi:organic hydroperoxide reductase OsmC/OhrA
VRRGLIDDFWEADSSRRPPVTGLRSGAGETDVVEAIAHLAHQICPYSKSVRGNIEIGTTIVTA